MKIQILLVLVIGFAALVASDFAEDRDATEKWNLFKNKHGKHKYKKNEEVVRMSIFLQNDQEIEKHNKKNHTKFKQGHNHISDMTEDEKKNILGAVLPAEHLRALQMSELPMELRDCSNSTAATLDYRTHKCLGPVKDQKQCGSCWSFSANVGLEFSYCKKYGSYVSLSEQHLVDCDTNDGGCNGGFYTNAWSYLQSKGGSEATVNYPYTAVGGTCSFALSRVVAKVSTFAMLPAGASSMQAALTTYGPLSVAIYATSSFQRYASGVYDDKTACPLTMGKNIVNHAVNVVGYGTGSTGDYWIVRNSWGPSWGQAGYILMQRGVNLCNIETYPAYVVAV